MTNSNRKRVPSRNMPKVVKEPPTRRQKIEGWAAVLGTLAVLFYSAPVQMVVVSTSLILLFVAVNLWGDRQWNEKREQLLVERKGESICTFARSFPRREVDTWVIRAVYDELQQMVDRQDSPRIAIRASDHPLDDWHHDPADMYDKGEEIAKRCGRSLEDTSANPYFGKVNTFGDVVFFLNAQPVL